ncbi:GNAT family N-acetyltransferase [Vibrio parahaemolyticus]|uniref:GNAT family N-acetyltransferase n=1 Tax=Vibrio parahaemolyticus TaxID=670 RepID=UPI000A9D50C7|nr:GNAT family N-acetyltransferase [Vibrio parahaemolyticus]EHR6473725.1 GNAT family N-acetyltransferase [Vibrio parahaemolyticus]EHZ7319010.1 GNAT family N-acetyltransferase [Vibrio parahaemolyticus]EIA4667984.1 GNAT family N-acetyltransferase [Vibrio parahaemolyticus]EIC2728989.1 GNAT family N-acetyltransferase [Vibrio parahaemolyticus]
MEIVTDRLKMTQITDKDWELFESLHRNPAVISLCFDEPSTIEIRERFESRLSLWTKGSGNWLCFTMTVLETGEKIGVTGFYLVDGVADVGYLILPQYHGLKFGTESLRALIKWAFNEHAIKAFSAVVTEGNVGSEKVLIKSGFSLKTVIPNAYKIGGKLIAFIASKILLHNKQFKWDSARVAFLVCGGSSVEVPCSNIGIACFTP